MFDFLYWSVLVSSLIYKLFIYVFISFCCDLLGLLLLSRYIFTYRVTAVFNVETDIIIIIAASLIGRTTILVMVYVEIFITNLIIFYLQFGHLAFDLTESYCQYKCTDCDTDNYHPSLPLYLPADTISKTRIKVRVIWAGLINSEQELSPNSPNI